MNLFVFLSIVFICIYIASYITAPFITIFHELGHAIAILLLTKTDQIDIYIGSYGDKNSKIRVKIGKLVFYIKLTFSFSTVGMCHSTGMVNNYKKKLVILSAGALLSFLFSCLIGFLVISTEFHGAIKSYFACLIVCSFIAMFNNLVPRTIHAKNLYNDGKQIIFTYKIRKVYNDYVMIQEDLLVENYEEALKKIKIIVAIFPWEEILIRQYISILLLAKEYEEAEKQHINLEKFAELIVNDYIIIGYLQILSNRNTEAIINFHKALRMDSKNPIALNNIGHTLILLEKHEEGQPYLEKAIKLDPAFAEPYIHLAQIKIFAHHLEEGKILIDKSIMLNDKNAHAYKNLGLYYLKTGNAELASLNFAKAIKLDNSINLEQYIQTTC